MRIATLSLTKAAAAVGQLKLFSWFRVFMHIMALMLWLNLVI
jgi:hypothetical protein